jgi:maltodextrin utilization protein YvdJ
METLVLLLSNIAGRKWRWRELFSIGLFAVTLPSLIEFIMGFVRSNYSNLFFVAFLSFLIAIVFTKDETEQLQKLNKTV